MSKHHIPLGQEILSWISFFVKAFSLIALLIFIVLAIGKSIEVTNKTRTATTELSH